MKRVLALFLSALMVLSMSACRRKQEEGVPLNTTATTTTTTADSDEEVTIAYAHNEVINRFFVNYMELHKGARLDTDTIRRGKDLKEYFAEINECFVTVSDISAKKFPSGKQYALQITIEGGSTSSSLSKMLSAFSAIILAADKGLSNESALAVEEYLAEMTVWEGPVTISEHVTLQYYTPTLSGEGCRMDLYVTDPLVTNDTTIEE